MHSLEDPAVVVVELGGELHELGPGRVRIPHLTPGHLDLLLVLVVFWNTFFIRVIRFRVSAQLTNTLTSLNMAVVPCVW